MGWFENNVEADVPPEHLWDDQKGLELWWQRVKNRRGSPTSPGDDGPDDGDGLVENELARAFKD